MVGARWSSEILKRLDETIHVEPLGFKKIFINPGEVLILEANLNIY